LETRFIGLHYLDHEGSYLNIVVENTMLGYASWANKSTVQLDRLANILYYPGVVIEVRAARRINDRLW